MFHRRDAEARRRRKGKMIDSLVKLFKEHLLVSPIGYDLKMRKP